MQKTFLALISLIIGVFALNAASPSGSLPVMYINTENNSPITSKEDYVKATYYLDPNGAEGVEAFGSASQPLALQIRGRGNFTWTGFEKKPYRLKLDKKAALFGEAKSKHWALLAHADDNRAFLRNTVGFQLSRLIGLPWTPCDHPVEVVLNGDYIGLYFLTETVRVDKDRVDVWDYDSEYEDFADANPGQTLPWQDEYATGGWLVEIDNYIDADQIVVRSKDPYNYNEGGALLVTYDTPSDFITDAHKAWLQNEFETLDALIIDGDRNECKWVEKIDITNLAKFFVVNQIVFNYESFHGSCKLSREKGADSKWNFGPVWDFGSAFQTGDVQHFFFDWGPYSNHWIKTMYEYPAFRDEVKRVYKELMEGGYASLDSYIDSFVSHVSAAAAADRERWGALGYGNDNMQGEKETVKEMLRNSVAWLNAQWSNGDNPDPIAPSNDIYLRGDINEWGVSDEFKFTKESGSRYTLKLPFLTGSFKLAGPEWNVGNVDFGSSNTLGLDVPLKLVFGGQDIALAEDHLEDVTLLFDWAEKTLTASCKHGGDDENYYTVYFRNDDSNPWDVVNIFTFNPTLHGDWPGTAMEPVTVNGELLWMHKFEKKHEEGAVCLVFNNGDSGVEIGNQTDDCPLKNNAIYTINGLTDDEVSGVSEIDDINPNAPVEYYNLQGIHVDNPSNGIFIRRQGNKSGLVKL